MGDNERKPVLHLLPAILTGAAALVAALTTLYVNVQRDRAARAPVQAAHAPPAVAAVPVAASRVRLRIDRIAVLHDGSIGTTDWRFAVTADGQPVFVFTQDDLDDSGGRNVALPEGADGVVTLPADGGLQIGIQGWRGSRLRLAHGTADAHGEAALQRGQDDLAIPVRADPASAGEFVFEVSAAAVD